MSGSDRRKEKLKDIYQDAQGNPVYTGELFRISGDQRHSRTMLVIMLILLAAAVIGSGCIDAAGANNSFYVILPYIGEVSSLFALSWNAVKVISGADSLRKYVFEKTEMWIPGACRMLTVFAAAGLIMSVVYIVRTGGAPDMKTVMYPALKLAAAVLSELYRKLYCGLEWESAA